MYIYKFNKFYIEDPKELKIDFNSNCVENDFQDCLLFKPMNYSIDDEMQTEGKKYLGYIHELTHYFQDLSIPSCIADRIYRTKIAKKYIDNNYIGIDSPILLNEEESYIYQIIYNSFDNVDKSNFQKLFESSIDFDLFQSNQYGDSHNRYFPIITYKDLLESYAELKAWQSIICETEPTESNSKYILNLLRQRNDSLVVDECGRVAIKTFDYKYERYSIARVAFLAFFKYCKPTDFYIYQDINGVPLVDYLLFMGNNFTIDVTSVNDNGILQTKEIDITGLNEREYLGKYETQLIAWILLALEVALTIPTTSKINNYIKSGKYQLNDFVPTCRFFKVLSVINRYPEYFNNLSENDNWLSNFNIISELLNWPSYNEIKQDIQSSNIFFHSGSITIYQNALLDRRQHTTIESNNGNIQNLFKNLNIPIIIKYPHVFCLVRYDSGNLKQLVMGEHELLKYYDLLYDDMINFALNDELLLMQIWQNFVNMSFYDNLAHDKWTCLFPYFTCITQCNIKDNLELFLEDNSNCAMQNHIRKYVSCFQYKIDKIYGK